MSDFDFNSQDYQDSNSFLVAAGEKQTNRDRHGNEKPLKTTQSQRPPKETLTVFSISDAAMNAGLMKPTGASSDIYNRVGQDTIASGIAENGGIDTVLGPYSSIAPTDLILKANALPTSTPDFGGGGGAVGDAATGAAGATSSANMGDFPPPSGEYRSNDEMRNIYSIDGGVDPPHGAPQIVSFSWWNGGRAYSVNAATVPIWTMMDSIMKKYNYGPRPEETGGGGYNRRKITGGPGWSLHAYGIAVDINPTTNPYSKTFQSDMPPDMVSEILQIKTKSGLTALRWGGHYKNNKDAMHYEVMVTPAEIQEGLTMGGQATTNISSSGNRKVRKIN